MTFYKELMNHRIFHPVRCTLNIKLVLKGEHGARGCIHLLPSPRLAVLQS